MQSLLWSGDIAKKHGVKVAWSTICQPKEEGGLGLRDFSLWNKTLNLKLIWLLFSKSDSLWVAWMRKHNLKDHSFWSAPATVNSSWIWKSLTSMRHLALKFLRCSVRDGDTAKFWFDHWLPTGPLLSFVGQDGPLMMGIPMSSNVAEACTATGWRLPSHRVRHRRVAEVRDHLTAHPLPTQSQGPDVFSWEISGIVSSDFSSGLTWEHLRPKHPKLLWTQSVWFKGCIPKHAFTFWVAHLDRLPVRQKLVTWGMDVPDTCVLCNRLSETRDHLFLDCEYSKDIWAKLFAKLGASPLRVRTWAALVNWLQAARGNRLFTIKHIAAQATIYLIWRERNSRMHAGNLQPHSVVFKQLDRCVRDIVLARKDRKRFKTMLSIWFRFD